MFPCDYVDGLWPTKTEYVLLIVRAVSFQDFQPSAPDPPTSQTNGQTTCNRNTALCTIVHRAVKTHFCVSCFQTGEQGRSSSGTQNENEIGHYSDSNVSWRSPTATIQSSGLCHVLHWLRILMSSLTQTIFFFSEIIYRCWFGDYVSVTVRCRGCFFLLCYIKLLLLIIIITITSAKLRSSNLTCIMFPGTTHDLHMTPWFLSKKNVARVMWPIHFWVFKCLPVATRRLLPRDASAERGYEIACRLSVRLAVTLRYDLHTGWNTSKIISQPNSSRPMRLVTSTWAIWCNGNTPKIRVE